MRFTNTATWILITSIAVYLPPGCGTHLIYGAHADFYWQDIKFGYPCSCTRLQVQGTYKRLILYYLSDCNIMHKLCCEQVWIDDRL
ncbi:unnamed protein product [Cuscuta campestris]|uniref:Uncharacterized protein n=1 Tax=Cuscuta campestris TaxID=132261 RepID=A0A484JZR2_9ASTE|nr:unnamed protein product [Cuscuta campestris]